MQEEDYGEFDLNKYDEVLQMKNRICDLCRFINSEHFNASDRLLIYYETKKLCDRKKLF